jgi:thioredoxin reductase/Pyruvate/2-oxoacid:ferredoxin oxidoreductase delta subunit
MLTYIAFAALLAFALRRQLRRFWRREASARLAAARGGILAEGPRAQHPRIDVSRCIGCAGCVHVCPEGDVIGLVAGKAALVQPQRCIGHGLCADACPVGAITIVMAPPSVAADIPNLTPELETTVPGLYVAGELGGLALIRNAVAQGRECIDTIRRRLVGRGPGIREVVDVCIVGAGPAGFSASLRAHELSMSYVTLEQDDLGGNVAKFPRHKVVMTTPFELPIYGRFKKLEVPKEALLDLWVKVARETGLHVRTGVRVDHIRRDPDGTFAVETPARTYRARAVVLAIGRRGTPRKLGVAGEELPKVMYHLLDAESYTGKRIVVVGGGDSAIEAALGLSEQPGNRVTISYRREAFSRLKARNESRLVQALAEKRLEVAFRSNPLEVRPTSVLLDIAGTRREIANDYVWVFAGGTPPSAFLEKIGVTMGARALSAA